MLLRYDVAAGPEFAAGLPDLPPEINAPVHARFTGAVLSYRQQPTVTSANFRRDYLAFRDYLRTDAAARRQFADLKRVLAARFPLNREAYMNAKSPHVEEILQLAISRTGPYAE
jgi:GrpB-like predicted nucleotidyltransferase (UPF0157 family)